MKSLYLLEGFDVLSYSGSVYNTYKMCILLVLPFFTKYARTVLLALDLVGNLAIP